MFTRYNVGEYVHRRSNEGTQSIQWFIRYDLTGDIT